MLHSNASYRLAPFVLLSLLLHGALLFFIRPTAPPRPAPMTVYLSLSAAKTDARPDATPKAPRIAAMPRQARILTSTKSKSAPFAVQPVQPVQSVRPAHPIRPDGSPQSIDSLLESAKNIAHDDAKKFEQRALVEEKKNLDTPAAALAQALRQPHNEIRMANGMLKIITAAGEVCFQPPPLFAHDQPGLYGIPRTCP